MSVWFLQCLLSLHSSQQWQMFGQKIHGKNLDAIKLVSRSSGFTCWRCGAAAVALPIINVILYFFRAYKENKYSGMYRIPYDYECLSWILWKLGSAIWSKCKISTPGNFYRTMLQYNGNWRCKLFLSHLFAQKLFELFNVLGTRESAMPNRCKNPHV